MAVYRSRKRGVVVRGFEKVKESDSAETFAAIIKLMS